MSRADLSDGTPPESPYSPGPLSDSESPPVRVASFVVLFAVAPAVAAAQSPFDSLHFRSIGPAATGGRVHDIEVDPRDHSTIYIGSATGGIWKTCLLYTSDAA